MRPPQASPRPLTALSSRATLLAMGFPRAREKSETSTMAECIVKTNRMSDWGRKQKEKRLERKDGHEWKGLRRKGEVYLAS